MGKTESAVDHLGNSYKSIVDMCKHYKIDYPAYKSRLIRGWTLEEALTIPKHDNKSIKEVLGEIKDHEGVEYGSIKAMCNAWGISEPLFRSRIRRGFTIEQALSDRKYYKTIVDRDTIIDHLGNKFDTVTDMCKYHNISYKTFAKRIQVYGWDLGKALTYKSPVVRKQSEPIKDHLGNEYATIKEMCEKYNIKVSTYAVRINRGATVEDALTKPIQTESTGKPITDHLGNHFPSITEMCKAHNIGVSAFKSRVYIQGWSIEQALTEPLRRNRRKR